MSLNKSLREARRQKNDEFYTQLPDIENEMRHYSEHFLGKVVYCNCDDPASPTSSIISRTTSSALGLKKLDYRVLQEPGIATCSVATIRSARYGSNTTGTRPAARCPMLEDIGIHDA